jgi:hypothetical protein
MTTSYKILFVVEVLHEYYSTKKCNDFKFIPSAHTVQLLKRYNALCKNVGNKLIVLMKEDGTGKPFIELSANEKFTFYMELMVPRFMTVSSLHFPSLSGKRFYFTNLHQNKVINNPDPDHLYLTSPVSNYQNAVSYKPGAFVKHNNIVYENSKASSGITPPNTAHWFARSKNQLAQEQDLLKFITALQSFQLNAPATAVTVSVFTYDTGTSDYTKNVLEQTHFFEQNVSSITVDMSSLQEGKYKIIINGNTSMVYLSNEAVYNGYFGVVDVFTHSFADAAFNLLEADGTMKDKKVGNTPVWLNYMIRFANRLAYWKYITRNKGINAVEGTTDYTFAGNANPADFFLSQQPVPLQEQAHEFKLDLIKKVSTEPPPAPNPDINASGMLTEKDEDYYCNIYINY